MQAVESARRAVADLGSATLSATTPAATGKRRADHGDQVELWLETLRLPEQSEEDLVVILRAIRICHFPQKLAEEIVLAATPLLLPGPSLPVRGQAAGCVLQYVSICTTEARQRLAPNLVTSISKALASAVYQLAAGGRRLYRFASTCLRILALVANRALLADEDKGPPLIALVAAWSFAGSPSAASGLASPAPGRRRTPSSLTPGSTQLSFGVMSAFAQTSPRKRAQRPPPPAQTLDASATCTPRPHSRSETRMSDSESETDSEAGEAWDRLRGAAQLRVDALRLLQKIATIDSRALHRHWHLFLTDSPFLRNRPTLFTLIESDPSETVRIQAAAALKNMLETSEAFLAIAEERSTKAAFTSLSRKVGETVIEMHLSLASCLERTSAAGRIEVHLAQLSLAEILGRITPYGRLRRPMAWTLSKAIVPLLSHEDPRFVQGAVAALCAVARRQTASASKAPFDWQALQQAATALLDASPAAGGNVAWQLLAVVAESQASADWSAVLDRAVVTIEDAAPDAELAQISLVAALLRSEQLAVRPKALLVLTRALESPHPAIATAACAALPSLRASDFSSVDPWTMAADFATSTASSSVRRAAVRALGVMAKEQSCGDAPSKRDLDVAVLALLGLLNHHSSSDMHKVDGSSDLRETCWALANVCDHLTSGAVSPKLVPRLLSWVTSLTRQDRDDEQITSSALRIVGNVGRCGIPLPEVQRASTAEVLCDGMAHPAAKVRWNACIAASTLLTATSCDAAELDSPWPVTRALVDCLAQDSSFKVRIHAATALASAPNAIRPLREEILSISAVALQDLEAQLAAYEIANRERAHAEVLVKRLRNLVASIDAPGAAAQALLSF
ncbi:hypothetical protein JCM3774_001712 [Rhodotorula dairenensis]